MGSEESDIVQHDSEIALQQPIELEEENQKGQLAEAEQPKQGKSTVAYEESDYVGLRLTCARLEVS